MEESQYTMTQAEYETAKAWVHDKCSNLWAVDGAGCPGCRKRSWMLPSTLVEVRGYARGNVFVPGIVVAYFVLECKNCGHTLFINAEMAGIKRPVVGKEGCDE